MTFEVPIRKGKKDSHKFTGGDCLKDGRDIADTRCMELHSLEHVEVS